jgi:hypothetical protein
VHCLRHAALDAVYANWLGVNETGLRADLDCICYHCEAYRKDPEAAGYWTMFKDGDRGHWFRQGMMPCGKVPVPELNVPTAPADSGLRDVWLYPPECCGLEMEESEESVCERCGWAAVVGHLCPTEEGDETKSKILEFGKVQRGNEKIDEEDATVKMSFQKVPLEMMDTVGGALHRVERDLSKGLYHYYSFTMQDTMMKSATYTFEKDTLMINADFAAHIAHLHSNNLTCSIPNNSNCEVFVVALNPKDGPDGRTLDAHVWFAIGPTASKLKEADSHFHNAVLTRILDHYMKELEGITGEVLRRVLTCTDGCKGQYKGRFNFKKIAGYAQSHGITFANCFAATAHFKGFHDALGKMIAQLLQSAEQYNEARCEYSYDLAVLARSKLEGEVPEEARGKGLHAVHYYFVLYVTSDPADGALAEDTTVYIDRTKKWDCDGIKGSDAIYLVVGDDPGDTEHVRTKVYFCGCSSCRRWNGDL